jgi:GR25 family glycosyltransferase involved in LPS biosynthesis
MSEVYLINLSRRRDRLVTALAELDKVNAQVTRIEAVDSQSFQKETSLFISKAAYVCALSHKKALLKFLESNEAYGIIVEDDLVINSPSSFDMALRIAHENDLDLLQIGYVKTGVVDTLDLFIVNLMSSVFKSLNFILKKINTPPPNRIRLTRNLGLPRYLVPDNFRAGAHCYLISRRFALTLINVIETSNNTYDGLLMSISLHRKFRIARLRKSAVNQRKTESDIKKRA